MFLCFGEMEGGGYSFFLPEIKSTNRKLLLKFLKEKVYYPFDQGDFERKLGAGSQLTESCNADKKASYFFTFFFCLWIILMVYPPTSHPCHYSTSLFTNIRSSQANTYLYCIMIPENNLITIQTHLPHFITFTIPFAVI